MSAAMEAAGAPLHIPADIVVRRGKQPDLAPQHSEMLGYVADPDGFFEAEKARIRSETGNLAGVRVTLNRILVALYVRPNTRDLGDGRKLIIPDQVLDEDKWQGVAGLVIAMGPHCYEENDRVSFVDADRCEVGDWVMMRRGEGFRTRVWKWECIVLESEAGIKMVLPRPDVVF